MGPYSILLPHRDGQMEFGEDRVPCNRVIDNAYKFQSPLALEPGFEDQSRYGSFKSGANSNPRLNDQIRKMNRWLLTVAFATYVYFIYWWCPTNGVNLDLYYTEKLFGFILVFACTRIVSSVLGRLRFKLHKIRYAS